MLIPNLLKVSTECRIQNYTDYIVYDDSYSYNIDYPILYIMYDC